MLAMNAWKSNGTAGPDCSPSARASRKILTLVSCSSSNRNSICNTSLAEFRVWIQLDDA